MALNGFQFQSNCLCRRDFILRKENTKCGARPYIFKCNYAVQLFKDVNVKLDQFSKLCLIILFVAKISKEVGVNRHINFKIAAKRTYSFIFMCQTPYDLIRNIGSDIPIAIYSNL